MGTEVQVSSIEGVIGQEVYNSVEVFCSQLRCRIVELNVQPDHVHRVPRSGGIKEGEATCFM